MVLNITALAYVISLHKDCESKYAKSGMSTGDLDLSTGIAFLTLFSEYRKLVKSQLK